MSTPYTLEQINDMLSGIVANESNRRPWLPEPLRIIPLPTRWKGRCVFCGWAVRYDIDLHPVDMNSHRGFGEVCGMIDELLKPFFDELDLKFPRPVEAEGAAT